MFGMTFEFEGQIYLDSTLTISKITLGLSAWIKSQTFLSVRSICERERERERERDLWSKSIHFLDEDKLYD